MDAMGKARVNLTVSEELVREARAAGVNLSGALEEALTEKLRVARWSRWREENAQAVQSYNDHVAEHGVFGRRFRRF